MDFDSRKDSFEVRENDSKSEGFRQIKPQTEISLSEANEYFREQYRSVEKEKTKDTEYFDDNGVLYRKGDSVVPNSEIKLNGYLYKTDDMGRTISVEGKLQKKNHEGRSPMDSRDVVGKGESLPTDDRGHLIADRFNGSGDMINLVPMDGSLNKGDYAKLENTLSDAVSAGADVKVNIAPVYKDGSNRPSEFRIAYSIDGEKSVIVFKNGGERK